MAGQVLLRVEKSLQRSMFKEHEDYSDIRYMIVPVEMLDELDFDELTTTSKETARRSVDGKLAIISYRVGKFANARPIKCESTNLLTNQDILKVVTGKNWTPVEEELDA